MARTFLHLYTRFSPTSNSSSTSSCEHTHFLTHAHTPFVPRNGARRRRPADGCRGFRCQGQHRHGLAEEGACLPESEIRQPSMRGLAVSKNSQRAVSPFLSSGPRRHTSCIPCDSHGAVIPRDSHGAVLPRDSHGAATSGHIAPTTPD
eukprot:2505815-Pleurochrysis_carterae.AAC.2